ncbi:DUF5994 family protein [Kibdelosporangium phytohabitans]|uniref:Uncharacterized protein n=1 Tax=Kibdelosporangium phytohabitans TaxID=860235 RepID=A0A0N9I264_9PSEU|nr:DUF5994 family protein [Kibdelosporangium phytohabitans]ALG09771.1 hypothetical protein AOZ06_25290 [Kibdelosporangium phytohabitans]MBE1468854.1 hypothetical protein [Kibdelosporangium phytohabitans]
MSSEPRTIDGYPTLRQTKPELRLKLKPGTATRGGADGAWWPRSADPATEFPALVMALSSWVGPVRHVAYHPADWHPAEQTLTVEDWTVRLEARPAMAADTVVLIGPNHKQLCVVVVPPGTPTDTARAALRSASSSDTIASAADFLADNGIPVSEASARLD